MNTIVSLLFIRKVCFDMFLDSKSVPRAGIYVRQIVLTISLTKTSDLSISLLINIDLNISISHTGGGQKKVATHRKWGTWFIMAINEKNVNKSYVFCTCVGTCG